MTKAERKHLDAVASLGCIIRNHDCLGRVTIHHCGTHMGGGRNHMRVIPLCWAHHLGPEGIDGKKMGKRIWEGRYGSEKELMAMTHKLLARQA